MIISSHTFDRLSEQAKASPRLRAAFDLRNREEDGSQRMLNEIEPKANIAIHRHRSSLETITCLRGKAVEVYSMSMKCNV